MELPRGRGPRRRSCDARGRCPSPRASTTCSRRARRSPRRTRSASSTAISSRRTCSSRTARGGMQLVKVLDFGISKVTAGGRARVSLTAHHRRHGLAALHVARAAARDARTSTPHRHLGARRDAVPARLGATCPGRPTRSPSCRSKIAIDPAAAAGAPAPGAGGVRAGHPPLPGEGPGAAITPTSPRSPRRWDRSRPNGRAAVDRVRRAGHVAGACEPRDHDAELGGRGRDARDRRGRGRARVYGIVGALVLGGGITAVVAMRGPAHDDAEVTSPPDAAPPPRW